MGLSQNFCDGFISDKVDEDQMVQYQGHSSLFPCGWVLGLFFVVILTATLRFWSQVL